LAEQILSLNKLAFRVGISREALEAVAKNKANHYDPFVITEMKADGHAKQRRIDNPDKAIRTIQRRINKKILEESCKKLPAYTTGSIAGRSIYDNAKPHSNKEALLLVDISNCFPSIKSSAVYSVFKDKLGCSPPVANVLTKLTTYGNRLPQGAPTSPSLCNLVLAPMASQLASLAASHNLTFTQYVDDLTFSGDSTALMMLQNEVIDIIQGHGFKVNRQKLKLIKKNSRMAVTGLVVNQGVGVGRKYIRKTQRDIMHLKSEEPRIMGKIAYVASLSKAHARKLKRRLRKTIDKQSK